MHAEMRPRGSEIRELHPLEARSCESTSTGGPVEAVVADVGRIADDHVHRRQVRGIDIEE